MRAIGFRVENDAVRWGVVEGTASAPVLVDSGKLRPPKVLEYPASLAWYRQQVQLLVDQFEIQAGGVRHPESVSRGAQKMFPRVRVEGVVAEALHSKGVTETVCGPLKTISSALGSKAAKSYLSSSEIRGLDWDGMNKYDQEALLVAVASLED